MRLFVAPDEAVRALEDRFRMGCEMIVRDVRSVADLRRLKAEAQNWEALNYTFLKGNFFDRSYAKKYFALMNVHGHDAVELEAMIEHFRDRICRHLKFLSTIREQLAAGENQDPSEAFLELISVAAASGRLEILAPRRVA